MLPEPAEVSVHGQFDRAAAERVARGLRAMADPTRVQILSLIIESTAGRRSVTDLADELGLTQPTVSHHLRIMVDDGILDRTQEGRQVWCSIAPERMHEVFDSVRVDPIAALTPELVERITTDLSARFDGSFSSQTIRAYVEESHALLASRSASTRYLASLSSRFAADRLRALAHVNDRALDNSPEVLFVCVQNAGRSQLASAILRALAGDRVRVSTAGSDPAGQINPRITAALDEIGVPLSGEYPKPLTDEVLRAADYVITMGCGDACPVYPGRTYLDWDLPDPARLPMTGVREIRDDIDGRVRALLVHIDAMNVA